MRRCVSVMPNSSIRCSQAYGHDGDHVCLLDGIEERWSECSLCGALLTTQFWMLQNSLPNMADDAELCSDCWSYARHQYAVDLDLEKYGYSHSDDKFVSQIYQAAMGMRQILQGLSKTCVMLFVSDEDRAEMPWCDQKNDKHSCYCPVSAATEALKLTKWLEV